MSDAGGLDLRIWPALEPEPRPATPLSTNERTLTRTLLATSDRRVSRGTGAVQVRQAGQVSVGIHVPEGALVTPVVFAGLSLSALQTQVPPATERWKVSPGALDDRWSMVEGDASALALLRAAAWDHRSEVWHVLRLPEPAVLSPGTRAEYTVPVTLAIAGTAVEVASPQTSAPPPEAGLEYLGGLDVAPLRRGLPGLAGAATHAAPRARLRIPGSSEHLCWPEVEALVEARAPQGKSWFLFPALDEDLLPRLVLAVRAAGGWQLLLSGCDYQAWVSAIVSGSSVCGAEQLPLRPPTSAPPVGPRDSTPPPEAMALSSPERFGEFATYDAHTAEVVANLRKVAPSELSVLLLGESGTGKELLAAQLHHESGRRGAFVAVNCAAIPENLMESELFGHVAGAYTGARGERLGAFLAAQGGTLFLDEIGDAPLSVQLGLLRALESRRIKPVGSDRELPVDVRVVAATSRDIDELVAADRFRSDLYHRVAQLALRVPPLRERQADVEWLAEDLLAAIAPSRRLTQQAKAALTAHGWPGNVRELKNTLERTVALSGATGPVQVQDLRLPNAALPALAPAENGRLSFPDAVQALARRALVEGVVPKPDEQSAKRGRAQQRAALLYLRLQASTEPWPPERTRQFQRVFGSQWATSEGGRGLAELMVTLGLNPNDANDRAELHDWLRRAGIAV